MQSLRIAYRNVLRQFKRTALLGGAIAFGFFIFTLLTGFTNGLLDSVSENFAATSGGHIYISGSEVSDLGSEISVVRDSEVLTEALTSIEDNVLSANTRSSARVSIIFGSSEETLTLAGVDFGQEIGVLEGLSFALGSTEEFLGTPNGILIPEEILEDLGVLVGENVILKTTTISGQQNIVDVVVAGALVEQNLFAPGASSFGYAHIDMLNELLGMDAGQYQTLNVYLNDLALLESSTDTLYSSLQAAAPIEPRDDERGGLPNPAEALGLGGLASVDEADRWEGTKFEVTNLNDNLDNINALVGIINQIGLIIFIVIIVIIMVGVTNSYRMVMIERTAEIGTMRAIGVHKAGIRNIFVWEALLVAASGALMGLVLAGLTMVIISSINFGTASTFSLFLNQGHMRFILPTITTLRNIVLICGMSAAAVYMPARAAA
ncbi:MAG: FtsX-like permease family protein, partial [Deinococcota bacterium]